MTMTTVVEVVEEVVLSSLNRAEAVVVAVADLYYQHWSTWAAVALVYLVSALLITNNKRRYMEIILAVSHQVALWLLNNRMVEVVVKGVVLC